MANRRTARSVERADPPMSVAVRAAAGDQVAAAMVDDRAEELDLHPGGGLLTDRLVIGRCYYVPTTTFPFVGRLLSRGVDYIELGGAAIVLYDGKHSTFMRTGRAPAMEVEPTGEQPGGKVLIPLDVMGCLSAWPHALFPDPV